MHLSMQTQTRCEQSLEQGVLLVPIRDPTAAVREAPMCGGRQRLLRCEGHAARKGWAGCDLMDCAVGNYHAGTTRRR